jgi:hypothetical protein
MHVRVDDVVGTVWQALPEVAAHGDPHDSEHHHTHHEYHEEQPENGETCV